MGAHFSNISQAVLRQDYLVDGLGQIIGVADPVTDNGASVSYYGPQLALVHDNSLFGWVGPFSGSRWRLEASPSFGAWKFTAGLVDWRRYFFARPFTLAVRGLFFRHADSSQPGGIKRDDALVAYFQFHRTFRRNLFGQSYDRLRKRPGVIDVRRVGLGDELGWPALELDGSPIQTGRNLQ